MSHRLNETAVVKTPTMSASSKPWGKRRQSAGVVEYYGAVGILLRLIGLRLRWKRKHTRATPTLLDDE